MIFAKANTLDVIAGYAGRAPDAGQGFHYYFPNSPEFPNSRKTVARLEGLSHHLACYNALRGAGGPEMSGLMRSFARFIDQDMKSNVVPVAAQPKQGFKGLVPMARRDVIHSIHNRRSGAMDLETVYAGSIKTGRAGRTLTALLRHPSAKGKMLDTTVHRCRAMSRAVVETAFRTHSPVPSTKDRNVADASTASMRDLFYHMDDLGNVKLPGLSDPQDKGTSTSEISDFQAFFLKLHNGLIDSNAKAQLPDTSGETLFVQAQDRVRWLFQWLVVNVFLPRVCHAETLEQVIAAEAPLYRYMASGVPVDARGKLPVPLEFSSAFRFLLDQGDATALRDDFMLNLPSAQACLAEVSQATGLSIPCLTVEELTSGETGLALIEAGFEQETPLWFYITKEAEVLCDGKTLGPLGTTLVANALLGALVVDEGSYWNQTNGNGARWCPLGQAIETIDGLERVARTRQNSFGFGLKSCREDQPCEW